MKKVEPHCKPSPPYENEDPQNKTIAHGNKTKPPSERLPTVQKQQNLLKKGSAPCI
jgi:hypothetical protein